MAKKRKLSGLSGLELTLAYQSLMKLQTSISEELEDEDAEDDKAQAQKNELFEQHLAGMINLMQSRLDGPQVRYSGHPCILFVSYLLQSYTFSGMTDDILTDKFNIRYAGYRGDDSHSPAFQRLYDFARLQPLDGYIMVFTSRWFCWRSNPNEQLGFVD